MGHFGPKQGSAWRQYRVHVREIVERVLRGSEEEISRQNRFRGEKYNINTLAKRMAEVLGVVVERVWSLGKDSEVVEARSLFCYWAVRELGVSATEVAMRE